MAGIAVPIRDRTGGVVASIGVWGAETSILGPRRDDFALMATIAARDISKELGYVEAPPAAVEAKPRRVAEAVA